MLRHNSKKERLASKYIICEWKNRNWNICTLKYQTWLLGLRSIRSCSKCSVVVFELFLRDWHPSVSPIKQLPIIVRSKILYDSSITLWPLDSRLPASLPVRKGAWTCRRAGDVYMLIRGKGGTEDKFVGHFCRAKTCSLLPPRGLRK